MTDNLRTAAQAALMALENSVDIVRHEYDTDWRHGLPTRADQRKAMREAVELHETTIKALREALAEPAQQVTAEPVAWMTESKNRTPMLWPTWKEASCYCDDDEEPAALYTFPPHVPETNFGNTEPVAFLSGPGISISLNPNWHGLHPKPPESVDWRIPLYASPPQRQPPSDAEIERLFRHSGGQWADRSYWRIEDADLHPFCRSLIAAQGIGEQP